MLTFAILIFLVISVLIIIYYFYKNQNNKIVLVVDNEKIKVFKKYPDYVEAAQTISNLNKKIIELIKYMKEELPDSDLVQNLKIRYNPGNFEENHKSFTIDKGKEINIKIRDEHNKLYDTNFLTFVLLHEITHVSINEKHHPPRFWAAFRIILNYAVKLGIYTPVDYRQHPVKYGDIIVKTNPYFG